MKSNGVDEVIVVAGFQSGKIFQDVNNNVIEGQNTIVLVNENYENDTNIISLQKAIEVIDGGYYIFEADIIFENDSISYVLSSEWSDKSVWFTCGPFKPGLYGGILKEQNGKVEDINIVQKFDKKYSDYKKLIGVMKVGVDESESFLSYVNHKIQQGKDCYYLSAWYENQLTLPSFHGDLSNYLAVSFNNPEEFRCAIDYFHKNSHEFIDVIDNNKVNLIDISILKEIEGHDLDRVLWLKDKVLLDGRWIEPLKIEKNNMLILDGHHRLQVAKQLGLSKVPCLQYEYHDVDVWSLRASEYVTKEEVVRRALAGNLYPYKTVKHKFGSVVNCSYSLDELGWV